VNEVGQGRGGKGSRFGAGGFIDAVALLGWRAHDGSGSGTRQGETAQSIARRLLLCADFGGSKSAE
jgi:hypothetical protein